MVNLITKGFPDRRRRERHRVLVVFKKLFETEELTLGRLWPEVSRRGAAWTYASLEHQVKWDWWHDGVVAIWISDVQSMD